METGELAQVAINVLEGSGNITDVIGNPFSSIEGFFSTIRDSSFRFRTALTIFLVWLSILIRVIKDANARSSSFWFQLLSVLLIIGFTPIIGLLLYIAIRPQGRKWDKTPWRDTLFSKLQFCENCGEFNQSTNLYCTHCGESLHTTCRECQSKYSISHSYCPNCGAPHLDE